MRSFESIIVAALVFAMVGCGDNAQPAIPSTPSQVVLGTRITFNHAGATSSDELTFDVKTITDSVSAGDLISIDVLVEDSTPSGWIPAEAGRGVSLFLDEDFRAFDQIETNENGHALLEWPLPPRSQVGAGPHIITAKLTLASTGIQLTPDSIIFGVLGPDTTFALAPAGAAGVTAGDTTIFPSDVPRYQQFQMWASIQVDDVTTDSIFIHQWIIDSITPGCTTLSTGAGVHEDPSVLCAGVGTDTAFISTDEDPNGPQWVVERPDMVFDPIYIPRQHLTGLLALDHE